tara:strand:- start:4065 stop:4301 length:237 start_codon:yes stop_codon:yes gene_type:complete
MMEYSYEDVERVLNFSSWTDKKKIDELFRIDCYMFANLGIDSTAKERNDVEKKSKYIYRAIKKIDPQLGDELLHQLKY